MNLKPAGQLFRSVIENRVCPNGSCFLVLGRGHHRDNCRSGRRCGKCNGKHHVSICEKGQGGAGKVPVDKDQK